ncbi:filamentous hemagglutinin domain protein [Bordetella holmesii 70147]|nr:filamentous hemagglutinin domain protein [Bordetella holmesii 70147]
MPILAGTLDATFKLDEPQLEDIDLDFRIRCSMSCWQPLRVPAGVADDQYCSHQGARQADLPRPYFETRLNYIDQSQFYGSGYFFQKRAINRSRVRALAATTISIRNGYCVSVPACWVLQGRGWAVATLRPSNS